MTPLGRLVERATRLPEVLVQMILEEVYRARIRRQEAARTIQTASLRPAFLRSRAFRAQNTATYTSLDNLQFMDWLNLVPHRYKQKAVGLRILNIMNN